MLNHGYSKPHLLSDRCFNLTLAIFFLILSSPILLVIALMIKLQDGEGVFYRGVRMGINKKYFTMYKFRTLIPDAEKIIGNKLLSHKHRVVTRLGKILRNTRLDELPQLFNIIKGDLNFIGPRPERPSIYQEMCRQIKFYDKRFSVAPGLIGYAQLFTPHSAPKEIRARIDNHFIRRKQSFSKDFGLVMYTMSKVAGISIKIFSKSIKEFLIRDWIQGKSEQRELDRIRAKKVHLFLVRNNDTTETPKYNFDLKDINDEAFLVSVDRKLEIEKGLFRMEVERFFRGSKTKKKKSAYCQAKLYKIKPSQYKEHFYVFFYQPTSPLNTYNLHQYILSKSIS